ncbi:AIR carboxylase family protein [Patulibacter sp. S7RM1-6]
MSDALDLDLDPDPRAGVGTIDEDGPLVGILVADEDDLPLLAAAGDVLRRHHVPFETRAMSPHHEPQLVADYCRSARLRGLRVLIAASALSAALPGIAAAYTDLPVIGVPLSSITSAGGGLDAVLSVVQCPDGVPVAAVGLDAARNAAHLAIRILGSADGAAPVR